MHYLLIKPTQSGKTFYVIDKIKNVDNHLYNIVLVSNNLLETVQFQNRVKEELGTSSFIFSSKSLDCKNIREAKYNLFMEGMAIMICCKNETRYANIDDLLKHKFAQNKKFNIWIDEADDKLKGLIPYIDTWNKLKNVNKITFITATPHRVKLEYPNITLLYDKYIKKKYVSLEDCNFVIRKDTYGIKIIGYIDYVLAKKHRDTGIKNSSIWFIPGGRTKKEHNYLKNRLIEKYNFNVLIINSNGWCLYKEKEDYIKYEYDNLSPEQRISKLYKKYKLNDMPFAITGEICIGRGVTFNSKKLQITHAIFSHEHSNNSDKAYQEAGRLTGNYKKYMKKAPKIYCTQKFRKLVIEAEYNAMNPQ